MYSEKLFQWVEHNSWSSSLVQTDALSRASIYAPRAIRNELEHGFSHLHPHQKFSLIHPCGNTEAILRKFGNSDFKNKITGRQCEYCWSPNQSEFYKKIKMDNFGLYDEKFGQEIMYVCANNSCCNFNTAYVLIALAAVDESRTWSRVLTGATETFTPLEMWRNIYSNRSFLFKLIPCGLIQQIEQLVYEVAEDAGFMLSLDKTDGVVDDDSDEEEDDEKIKKHNKKRGSEKTVLKKTSTSYIHDNSLDFSGAAKGTLKDSLFILNSDEFLHELQDNMMLAGFEEKTVKTRLKTLESFDFEQLLNFSRNYEFLPKDVLLFLTDIDENDKKPTTFQLNKFMKKMLADITPAEKFSKEINDEINNNRKFETELKMDTFFDKLEKRLKLKLSSRAQSNTGLIISHSLPSVAVVTILIKKQETRKRISTAIIESLQELLTLENSILSVENKRIAELGIRRIVEEYTADKILTVEEKTEHLNKNRIKLKNLLNE